MLEEVGKVIARIKQRQNFVSDVQAHQGMG